MSTSDEPVEREPTAGPVDDALLSVDPDAALSAPPREYPSWLRRVVVVLAVARYVVPILALGYLANVLASIDDVDPGEVVLLTLLRPAKETLLFAGGVLRVNGEPSALLVFLAYVPLMVVAVWVFFLLGRIYGDRLTRSEEGSWLTRAVPPRYVRATQLLLADRGPAIAILGRVVAAPPTILAAAAGTTRIGGWRYLSADAVGAVISFAMIFVLGLALGEAYERAGTWVTVGTFVVLMVAISAGQNWFQRELERIDAAEGGAPEQD